MPRPDIHARDHEHGGADTVRIVYESVGGEGGSDDSIKFNTDNEGGYLSITTNDIDTGGTGNGFSLFDDSDGGIGIEASGNGPILIKKIGSGGISIQSSSTDEGLDILEESTTTGHGIRISSLRSNVQITVGGDFSGIVGYLILTNLIDFDPHVAGAVWNNGGVLNISAG